MRHRFNASVLICSDMWNPGGGSRIFDAFGNVLAAAEADEECLLVADLNYQDVSRARFELPTVRDSNLGLIHREIERLVSRLGVPEKFRDL